MQTDEQLVGEYLKGDKQAFEILVKRYLKPIYSFAYKNVGNPEMAEDIAQETFVKVWKNLALYRTSKASSGAGFKTWIFTIAKNTCIDFLRKKTTVALTENLPCEKSNFIEAIEQKSILADFQKALKNLSPSYQAIVLLKYESGLTFREIAENLNQPLNTIKSRYRRAMFILKDILS